MRRVGLGVVGPQGHQLDREHHRRSANTYSGTFTASGGKLTVSPLATTRKACTDEAVSAQESAFTAALGSATTFAVGSDGNLTLKGAAEIVAKPGVAAS